MQTSGPVKASAEALRGLIPLARSPQQFLSVYMQVPANDDTMNGLRLRLASRLENLAQELAGTPLAKAFTEERRALEGFVKSVRPGGSSLAIISSKEAGVWSAMWLPNSAEDHVRFGRGAYILPLVDALDEWEPVGLVEVHKDKARILVLEADRVSESHHFEADVPGKNRVGGGAGARYRPGSIGAEAQHSAGGGAAARYERHVQTHVDQHLKEVAHELDETVRRTNLRRIFVAGAVESRTQFRTHLNHELAAKLMGDLPVNPRGGDAALIGQLSQASRQAERDQELALIQEIVTRAEKNQGAVAGIAPTLAALQDRQVRTLVLAPETSQEGRQCPACERLLPPEDIVCPRCDAKTRRVNLWEELPAAAMSLDVALELVHGQAASDLWAYEGIGGLLKPPAAH